MAVHPGSLWLEDHWSQLPKNFWVAAGQAGIVAQDKELPNLYSALRRLEIKLVDVTIAFIPEGIIQ